MTQKEFDDQMNEYRWQQTNETASLKLEVERLNSKRRALGQEMQALQQQISSVTAQRDALVLQIKEIGGKYWKLKNDLIRENPKAVPPTYAEAHAEAATC